MDMMAFQIRWRYLGISASILGAISGIVYGIHEFQMPSIAARVLNESRELAESGKVGEARARYADYLSMSPDNSDAYEEYADLVLASSDTIVTVRNDSTALKLLDAAVQNGSTSDETKVRLIQSAMRLKKYSMAQRMLRRIDLATLQSAEMYAADGTCDLIGERPDRAEKAFRKALKIDGKCVAAWEGLLEIEADINKDFQAAGVTADQMIESMPAKGQSAKAWLYIRLEDFQSAGKAFYAAASQLPGEQTYAFDLANFVMRAGVAPIGDDTKMVQFAFDNLKEAYSSEVSYDVAFLLGDIAQRLGRLQDSRTHYRMCLERRPSDSAAIGRIVEVHSEAGEFQSAEESLEAMPATKGLTVLKAVLKARLLADQSRFSEASDTLEEVVEIAGVDMRQSVHVLLMDCLSQQRRFDEACQYGFKLLTITGNADESRKLLVHALINDGRYGEAIRQIQLVFSPQEYYDPMLAYLREHAETHNLQVKLQTEMQAAQKQSRSSSLPRIYEAKELALSQQFATAHQLLIRELVDSPEAKEYWTQLNLLQDVMIKHYADLDLTDGLQGLPSEEACKYACLAAMKRGEVENVVGLLADSFSDSSGSRESFQLAVDVVELTARTNMESARQLLDGIYPEFYKRLREPSGHVTELTARLLFPFDEHQRLVGVHEYVVVNDSTIRLTAVMTDLVAEGKIDANMLAGRLGAENSPTDDVQAAVLTIINAEASIGTSELPEVIDQLATYVSENGISQPVVSSLLRLAGYDESIRPRLAEMGFWLKRQRPNDDYVLHLLSCGLRASRRYQESLAFSYQAFELNQAPMYLLHASYSLWLLNRTEKSRDTLQLAFEAGLQRQHLHALDQTLLERLMNDTEFQDVGLAVR